MSILARFLAASAALALLAMPAAALGNFPLAFRNPVPVMPRIVGVHGVPTVTQVQYADRRNGWAVVGEGRPGGQVVGQYLVAEVSQGTQVLWRTADGGRSWQAVHHFSDTVEAIDLLTDRDGYVLLGRTTRSSGLRRLTLLATSDGGRHLRVAGTFQTGPGACQVRFATVRSGLMICGDLLAATGDGGRSWRSTTLHLPHDVLDEPFPPYFLDFEAGFYVDQSAIFSTADGGATWRPVYRLPPTDGEFGVGPVTFVSPLRGYAALDLGSCWPGGCHNVFLSSSDGGRSWKPVSASLDPSLAPRVPRPGPPGGDTAIAGWGSSSVAVVGMSGMALSRDGGAHWRQWPLELPTSPALAVVGDAAFAAGDGGLLRLNPDGTWRDLMREAPTFQVDFVTRQDAFGLYLGPSLVLLRSRDGAGAWRSLRLPSGAGFGSISFADVRQGWFEDAGSGELFATGNGGMSWRRLTRRRATTIELLRHGAGLLLPVPAASAQAVEVTADSGRTFRFDNLPHGFSWPGTLAFASTEVGFATSRGKLWQTGDGGLSWRQQPVPRDYRAAFFVTASADAQGDLWLGVQLDASPTLPMADAIFERRANGTWTEIRLPGWLIGAMSLGPPAVDAISARTAALATQAGLFVTTDGGLSWRLRSRPGPP